MKNLFITLLLLLAATSYGQTQTSIAQNISSEFSFSATEKESSVLLAPPPYNNRARGASAGKTIKTIGIVVGSAGVAAALLDYIVLQTPNYWLAKTGAALSIASVPMSFIGFFMQINNTYGSANDATAPVFATTQKKASLAIVPGGIGICIDL